MMQRIYCQDDMPSPEVLPVCSGSAAVFYTRCPGKTAPNDDCAAIVEVGDESVVMVAADGVGGCPQGHKASEMTAASICKELQNVEAGSDLRARIMDGIEAANREVINLGVGAATTVTVVEINAGVARTYQVGDSMALIIGQRGALKWKSTPHSPVGYAIEAGMLDEEQAMGHQERHVVSNLVGMHSMHIDVGPRYKLAARDTVLLASDGLFDNVQLAEVVSLARSGKPLKRMDALAKLAHQRMTRPEENAPSKPDDLTILFYANGVKP